MQHVHFIAIGGAVMHNLAIALHKKGYNITGSDDEINEPSKSRLEEHGLLPANMGWDEGKITTSLDAVILGMHAGKDNPELLKALDLNVPVYSFPEYLYQQTSDKLRIVIGGSHGKTTITSMIMHVLKGAERDFDYMVGAGIEGFETMVKLTKNAPIAVFEGDEYLSSPIDRRPKFHLYHPKLALLSGIAWDHINVFPTREEYHNQFAEFVKIMDPGGVLVWCEEDADLARIVNKHGKHLRLIGYTVPPYRIEGNQTILITENGDVPLKIFGRHNLLNLEGARIVCDELNIDEKTFYTHISAFTGAARRLERMAQGNGVTVFRDFAHSPSKLKATVEAAREQFPTHRLVACFELHTFSSLNPEFLSEYEGAMNAADRTLVFYSPATLRHKKMQMISPGEIREAFGKQTEVHDGAHKFSEELLKERNENTVILLMSSGTFAGTDLKDLSQKLTS